MHILWILRVGNDYNTARVSVQQTDLDFLVSQFLCVMSRMIALRIVDFFYKLVYFTGISINSLLTSKTIRLRTQELAISKWGKFGAVYGICIGKSDRPSI